MAKQRAEEEGHKLEVEDSEPVSVEKVDFDGDSGREDKISGYHDWEDYIETYHGTILDKYFYCKGVSDGTDIFSEREMDTWMVPQCKNCYKSCRPCEACNQLGINACMCSELEQNRSC